eukprot:791763-Pyramimonas_sp.AAC.1
MRELRKFGLERFGNPSSPTDMQMAQLMSLAPQAQADQIGGRGRAHPELDIFDFLQARASLAAGKGAGAGGVPIE